MVADVHIPTRVRVDADVPGNRPELVVDALRAGVERALDHARDVTGTDGLARFEAPLYDWKGPGAAKVDDTTRAALERRVTAVFADVAARTRAVDWAVAEPLEAVYRAAFERATAADPLALGEIRGIVASTPSGGYGVFVFRRAQTGLELLFWLELGPLKSISIVIEKGRPRVVETPFPLSSSARDLAFDWICAPGAAAALEVFRTQLRAVAPADLADSAIEDLARQRFALFQKRHAALGTLQADGQRILVEAEGFQRVVVGARVPLIAWIEERVPGRPGLAEEQSPGPVTSYPQAKVPVAVSCASYEGEPALDQLGEDAALLRQLMAPIAQRLEITPCEYAGGFALMAARVFGGRAVAVSHLTETPDRTAMLRALPEGEQGNVGAAEFEPAPSPAIHLMRHLGAVAPELRALRGAIQDVYRKPEHAHLLAGGFTHWQIRFVPALDGAVARAVAELFATTCRILLLQLLVASQKQIAARRTPEYAKQFAAVIMPQLRAIGELEQLRDRLESPGIEISVRVDSAHTRPYLRPAATTTAPPLTEAEVAKTEWRDAQQSLADAIAPTSEGPAPAPLPGTLIRDEHGKAYAIRDLEGRAWTKAGLDRAIALRRGLAEDIDPLVKQLGTIPGALERFRDGPIEQELERLLKELAGHNEDQQDRVRKSRRYAVRASAIGERLPRTSMTDPGYPLGGIHGEADRAIGDVFAGDPFYAAGIRHLFDVESGIKGITDFVVFGGMLLLAVVCPPAALVAGIAEAGLQVAEAHQRDSLYRALIDPELVLSRAEVESGLFLAYLGLGLAIVPELPGVVKIGRRVVDVGVKRGLSAAGRAAPRFANVALRSAMKEAAEGLERGLFYAFVRELATDAVMDAAAARILGPIVEQIERDLRESGPQGGTAAVFARLQAESEGAAR